MMSPEYFSDAHAGNAHRENRAFERCSPWLHRARHHGAVVDRELTRDELEAEAGSRQRACVCASWELRAVGRCVCPDVRGEDEDASTGSQCETPGGNSAETNGTWRRRARG